VHRIAIGFGKDRNRPDSELLTGSINPQRDLAAIGDQNLFKNG
jgi:hypothetical protein